VPASGATYNGGSAYVTFYAVQPVSASGFSMVYGGLAEGTLAADSAATWTDLVTRAV